MTELESIQDAVKKVLPDSVDQVQYTLDLDSTDDPAVWIYVVLKDEVVEGAEFFEHAESIRRAIVETLETVNTNRWPYVHFTSASEYAQEPA